MHAEKEAETEGMGPPDQREERRRRPTAEATQPVTSREIFDLLPALKQQLGGSPDVSHPSPAAAAAAVGACGSAYAVVSSAVSSSSLLLLLLLQPEDLPCASTDPPSEGMPTLGDIMRSRSVLSKP